MMKKLTMNHVEVFLASEDIIDTDYILKMVEKAKLPQCKLFLLFNNDDLVTQRSKGEPEKLLGITFPEKLWDYRNQ